MQFNSYSFVLLFLPVTVLLYFLACRIRPALGRILLVIAGLAFYSVGRWEMLVCLGISILISYGPILYMKKTGRRSRGGILWPILANLALLFYFKYYNFAVSGVNLIPGVYLPYREIILPVGISFYTFQQIAYIVSFAKGDLPDADLMDYLAFILYFPKLVMGPLMEPADFIRQLHDPKRKHVQADNMAGGIRLFCFGLFKKVLIADTFSKAVSWVFIDPLVASSVDCLLMMLFFTFEIYFDFSGYSDMASGISMMLNIDLPINFNSPYKAYSIREFWKRWHISLTRFFTKYIYIPLGGSRKGRVRTLLLVMAIFGISGLWHGANVTFLLWGLLHGLLCCVDRVFEETEAKLFPPIRWAGTFAAVSILWLLFRAESIRQWITILGHILSMEDRGISPGLMEVFVLPETVFISRFPGLEYLSAHIRGMSVFGFVLASCVICFIPDNNMNHRKDFGILSAVAAAGALVLSLLAMQNVNAFIYTGF